jgi:hypothetical protein
VEKFTVCKIVNLQTAERLVHDPLFLDIIELEPGVAYEVRMRKRTIKYSLPHTISFSVYSYAKVKLLEAFFDVMVEFFDRSKFELLLIDTVSYYLVIYSKFFWTFKGQFIHCM